MGRDNIYENASSNSENTVGRTERINKSANYQEKVFNNISDIDDGSKRFPEKEVHIQIDKSDATVWKDGVQVHSIRSQSPQNAMHSARNYARQNDYRISKIATDGSEGKPRNS